MQIQIILEKTKFCHLLLSVDLNPVSNTAKSTKKGPTFRLVFPNERLVSETFSIAISLHISCLTVQVLKSPFALTVWQKTTFSNCSLYRLRNFRSDIVTTMKRQMAFGFEPVRRNLLSCTVKSIILAHNSKICTLLRHFTIQTTRALGKVEYLQVFHIVSMQLNKNRE